MSEYLPELFTTQFSTNIELLLQQMGSKFRGRVREQTHVGKQASPVNQVGSIQLKQPAGRFAQKNQTNAEFVRRWVFPQDGEIDQLIDSFDELRTIVDPKSVYVENASNAIGRGWDDAIIAAFTGTAQTGTDAGSLVSETFSTTNYQVASTFGASSANGLSVAKLIEAKRILTHWHNDLDADPPCIGIGSQQESDLLNQTTVVSTEFNDRPVLVDGKLRRFLGFEIVMSERLAQASSVRTCPVWVKSGMHLGMWQDQTHRVSIRNDLSSEPYDLYSKTSFGATRLQPGKVVTVLCSDSTGADINP
jgi:hypothetical protein